MSNYDNQERFPNRKHPRMKHYDYSTSNYYFVTICTRYKHCIFGTPEVLNTLGHIARNKLLEISAHFPDVTVDKYVVMPNHVHAIVVLNHSDATLSTVIGQYKSAVTKEIRRFLPNIDIWQSSFHDHVIRNQTSYEKVWLYIEGNPVKWQEDCFYTKISASN